MRLILASSSPNRKELFDRLGLKYQIIEPNYEEVINPKISPETQIQTFALGKAKSTLARPPQAGEQRSNGLQFDESLVENRIPLCGTNYLVMGFDSMIEFEGGALGKAENAESAFLMLQKFRGKTQRVMTGFALLGEYNGKKFEIVDYESSRVKFRSDITDVEIKKYVDFGDWKGKCGAYSILGPGNFLLEKIDGDFQNIVGVPLLKINHCLLSRLGKSLGDLFL